MTDHNSAPELLPCPFCGGEPGWGSGGPGAAWISCKSCLAETGDGAIPRVIAAWNRRTPADLCTAERGVTVAALPVAWVWLSPDGRVRSASNESPDDQHIAHATADGDRIIPVFAAPPTDNTALVEELDAVINQAHDDLDEHFADAEHTGERPDLQDSEAMTPVDLLERIRAALASREAPQAVTVAAAKWANLRRESDFRHESGGWDSKTQQLELLEALEALQDAALRALGGSN